VDRPKLRKLERLDLERDGEPLLVLRDPLGLSEPLAVDRELAPLLDLLEGERTVAQIRQSLMMRGVMSLEVDELEAFIGELSEAGLMEDDAFRSLWKHEHEAFLSAPTRPPRLAGLVYPADGAQLSSSFDGWRPHTRKNDSQLVGMLTPHQPFEGMAGALRTVLDRLPDPEHTDAIVALGTDHAPGLLPYALTPRGYETPIGVAETDDELCEWLDSRLPWLAREEIRHRDAPSLELLAIILRAVYGDRCPPVLWILCGQTSLTTRDGASRTDEFLATMEALGESRRLVYWASAELSHEGPAYGGSSLDLDAADARDRACLDALTARQPERFIRRCLEASALGRPSGAAAIATLARLLPLEHRAELSSYELASTPGEIEGACGIATARFWRS
jgi:AmmeMemoRadiSam system protein B